jgi:hypothetical protein
MVANDTVYVELLEPWRDPPPGLEVRSRSARARLFLFRADHSVCDLQCTLIDNADTWHISHGDPLTIVLGQFDMMATGLAVQRRVVSRTIRRVDNARDPLCTPGRYTVQVKGNDLAIDGKLASPTNKVSAAELLPYISEAEREGERCGG